MRRFIIGAIVNNQFGVLMRIASLFSRRGYNIDSLTVRETEDAAVSRMTITALGDESLRDQILKQLDKLTDVRRTFIMQPDKTIVRELMLIKVCAGERRAEIIEAADVFHAKVVDYTKSAISMELTGDESKLSAFLEYMRDFGILEVCRTGVTALERSDG